MIYRFLFILLLITYSNSSTAANNIVTSITPIASLVKMLVHDNIKVSALSQMEGCASHYQSSFADLKKIQEANLVIYIDDKFDKFITKLLRKNSNILKISDLKNLYLIKTQNYINFHLWLDLNNAQIILKELALKLSDKFPDIKNEVHQNLQSALEKIDELKLIKTQKLKDLKKIVIADDSLEYLFLRQDYDVLKLFQHDQKTISYLKLIEDLNHNSKYQCILINNHQNPKLYRKSNMPVISIDAENWLDERNLAELYYNKYIEIINKINQQCIY